MEEIIVHWYNYKDKTFGQNTVKEYSLSEAIQIVRKLQHFRVIIIKAEFKDVEGVIKSLEWSFGN